MILIHKIANIIVHVQYTREIVKIASVRDAKEHATEFFEE